MRAIFDTRDPLGVPVQHIRESKIFKSPALVIEDACRVPTSAAASSNTLLNTHPAGGLKFFDRVTVG